MSQHSWKVLSPERAAALSDARLQVHHAAQLATAFGISYLSPAADDSHTNLEWLEGSGALASRAKTGIRVALRVRDLTFEVSGRSFPARGRTVQEIAARIRATLSELGLDGTRYALARHYEIPSHPVAEGAPFDAGPEDLEELASWFANGDLLLERLRAREPGASEVRCWPHHFDIATLSRSDPDARWASGWSPATTTTRSPTST